MSEAELVGTLSPELLEKIRKDHAVYKKRVRDKYRLRHNEYYRFYRKLLKKAEEGVSKEEMALVKKFYKDRPKGYWVDHIIPITRGGKHCLSNLQYLRPVENIKKSNRLSGEECGRQFNRAKEKFEHNS